MSNATKRTKSINSDILNCKGDNDFSKNFQGGHEKDPLSNECHLPVLC